jgi:hypothetical protein
MPGAYTAYVSGKNGSTGTALVEVYDADLGSTANRLVNISTHALVRSGPNVEVFTGGFVIHGSAPKKVLIRAAGPALVAYGIPNFLTDPVLTVVSGQTVVGMNDDWGSNGIASTRSVFSTCGAFDWSDNSKDAALIITLQPGAYTAQVIGKNGAPGVALVEVYEVP